MSVNRQRALDRRDELDLRNAELAAKAQISEGYLINILCGADKPARRVRYRLERALGLEKDALKVTDEPQPADINMRPAS